MPNYTVQYTCLEPRKELEVQVTETTMMQAVAKVVSDNKGQEITSISCRISSEKSGGVQRFCDGCQVRTAGHGFKGNKWYCRECKI